jgi:hypothetical protein
MLTLGASALALAASACTANITDADGMAGAGGSGATQGGPAGGSASTTGGTPSTAGSPPVVTTPGQLNLTGSPKFFRVVKLTNTQWTNSVQQVLGLSSKPTNAESFQNAVSGLTDFSNNELGLDVDSRGWSDYQAAAEALAKQVTSDSAQLGKLYSGTDGAGFISNVGRRIYRRPLTTAESASYQKLFDMGGTLSGSLSNFAKGAGLVLEAMLQSPHFLYRVELTPAKSPLSSYEMATRLSLWLRDSAPDTALLDSAGTGALDSADGAAAAAQKMLEEAPAKSVMRNFHKEFLHFDRFENLSKVGVAGYDPAINDELAESSYLFFEKIFSQGLGLKDVFLSTTGFVGPKMAALYGGSAAAAPASGFAEKDLGPNRSGYFLQIPFLTLYAHNDEPDSIHRGVSMSLDVLCSVLGPPAGTIPPLPARMPGQTNRMRVDAHTNGCGSICHNQIINPLGFAFENFDGMGQFHETETHGTEVLPIDASGSFNFVEGKKSYQNAAELMKVLSTDQQAHLCYSKKLAGYGLQRSIVADDLPMLKELASISMAEGGSVKKVLVDLVKQDAFRVRAGGVQ